MTTLEKKTALVTGGSRGIGRAIVRRLAVEGATVLFTFNRNEAAAEEVVTEVADAGGLAYAVQADQGRDEDLVRLFAALDERFDGLDVLVNNAGINPTGPIADTTAEDFDRAFAVNTKGPLLIMRAAAERMRDGGRIVNLTTSGTAPGYALYFASKAALGLISEVAARELGERGITVNCVSPGATDTDMMRAAAGEYLEQAVAHVIGQTALKRLGCPEDIASVVAFLAGPDGGWITGQTLRASGGLTI